jgi:branched-chain amino acid transport system substrate-binding protein
MGVYVAASGSTAAGASSSPFTVYLDTALSGQLASGSKADVLGFQLAADRVNSTGGLDGRKISVHVANDNGSSSTAVSLLDAYLASHSAPNVIVTAGSQAEPQLEAIANAHHILSFSDNPTAPDNGNIKTFPLNFEFVVSAAGQAQGLINYVKSTGDKKVAIIAGDDSFGQGNVAAWESEVKAAGIQIVGTELYSDTALDMTPQLAALKADNPQILYISGAGTPLTYVLEDRKAMGWNVTSVGDPGVAFSIGTGITPLSAAGSLSAEAFSSNVVVPKSQWTPGYKALMTALAKNGGISQPLEDYSNWWDMPIVLQVAANQAKSTQTTSLAKALEHLKQPHPAPWVAYVYEGFSPTSHYLPLAKGDLIVGPAQSLASAFNSQVAQVKALSKG